MPSFAPLDPLEKMPYFMQAFSQNMWQQQAQNFVTQQVILPAFEKFSQDLQFGLRMLVQDIATDLRRDFSFDRDFPQEFPRVGKQSLFAKD